MKTNTADVLALVNDPLTRGTAPSRAGRGQRAAARLPRMLHCALLMSCVPCWTSCISVNLGTHFNSTNVNQLEIGTTSKAEASQLFGSPYVTIETDTWDYRRVHFGDEDTALIWRYIEASGSLLGSRARVLQLEFDRDGRLADYYYESGYKNDPTVKPAAEADFDLFTARESIQVGQTSRADVATLLGTNYVTLHIKQAGIAERWHYGYSQKSKTEKTVSMGQRIARIYGKSLDVDFDAQGIARHVQGESDFPEDLTRGNVPPKS